MWTKTAHEIFPLRRITLKKWRISKFLTAQWLLWWKAIFFLQDYFGLVRKTILSSWCYVSKMLNCSFWQWLCKFSSFFPPCLFWVFMEKLLKLNVVCIFGSYGVNKSLILMWPTDICSDVAIHRQKQLCIYFAFLWRELLCKLLQWKEKLKMSIVTRYPSVKGCSAFLLSCRAIKAKFFQIND